MKREIIREYKQGNRKNFFLREHEGIYFFEKITKACGFTIKCGTEAEIMEYINGNGYSLVGLIAK
jgi:hypothetical protein